MSAAETMPFEIIGTVARETGVGPGLHVAVSEDGARVALVKAAEGAVGAQVIHGPFEIEAIRRLAENVLAGNPRAVTWPKAQMVLALFTCSQFLLAERALREAQQSADPSPAGKGAPSGGPSEPTPPEVPPETVRHQGQGGDAAHSSLTSPPSEHPKLL